MIRFVVLAVHHEVLVEQASCRRYIFPCEPGFSAQMLYMFLPLELEKRTKFRLQGLRKTVLSPPRRKHLEVVLEKFVLCREKG